MNLLELISVNGHFKRVAHTNGGEWAGACPFCGGKDRFRVWPNEDKGRFWCRGCGKQGDAIDYLRESRGLSFLEAIQELGGESILKQSREVRYEREEKSSPSLKWQAKAEIFLRESVELLWCNSEVLSFLHGRGLQDNTIRAVGLGWNSRDRYEDREAWGLEPEKDEKGNVKKLWLPRGLVIPLVLYGNEENQSLCAVLRLRIRRPQGKPRYLIISGSDTRPMTFDLEKKTFVIVESELDGLLIHQEAGDLAGVIALGNAQAKPDEETNRILKQAGLILVALDFDEAGAKSSWQFWLTTYPNARRWPVPVDKDPSEAFQKGLNIPAWVEAGLMDKNSSLQDDRAAEEMITPFPSDWLQRFDEEQLERLAIMTIDGQLSDQDAVRLLN